ncbi:MAG: DUF3467 domain-containing protein [Pyrinomonadaceae bacterium]
MAQIKEVNPKNEITRLTVDTLKATRRPDAFTIFVNHTRFGHTKWDIQMICGQVTLSTDPNHEVVQELGLIAMSPVHAKAVQKALGESIAAYENEYGVIPEVKDRQEREAGESTADEVRDAGKPKKRRVQVG